MPTEESFKLIVAGIVEMPNWNIEFHTHKMRNRIIHGQSTIAGSKQVDYSARHIKRYLNALTAVARIAINDS